MPLEPFKQLLPLQQEFVDAMERRETVRIFNTDPTGTGKTPQAIFSARGRTLVLCTVSTISNWVKEWWGWKKIEAVGVSSSSHYAVREGVVVAAGCSKKKRDELIHSDWQVLILNYELFIQYADYLATLSLGTLIGDEFHKCKNPKSQAALALTGGHQKKKVDGKLVTVRTFKRLNAQHIILLSATPADKRPDEMWTAFNLMNPERYNSFRKWQENFCKISGPYNSYAGPRNIDAFQSIMRLYVVRRDKSLLNLPVMFPPDYRELEWDKDQFQMYKEFKFQNLSWTEDGEPIITPNVISQLMRLRQVCVSPALVGGKDTSPKMDFILDELENADRPICVYTSFAEAAKLLAQRCEKAKIKFDMITGADSAKKRDAAKAALNAGEIQLLIFTAAGGEGISLVGSAYLIFLDIPWAFKDHIQAIGRLDRLGQVHNVLIRYLVMPNSIDQKIIALQDKKQDWNDQMFAHLVKELVR